jgi:putative redox protein
MPHKTVVNWTEELAFDVELDGHHFMVDADPQFGGKNRGPRPKALLLAGLAGCTGMDVASMLDKMKMPFDRFVLEVEGTMAEEHPKYYTHIMIRYILYGKELDRNKIEKAVSLSLDKYCAVHYILAKSASMRHEIVLNPDQTQ